MEREFSFSEGHVPGSQGGPDFWEASLTIAVVRGFTISMSAGNLILSILRSKSRVYCQITWLLWTSLCSCFERMKESRGRILDARFWICLCYSGLGFLPSLSSCASWAGNQPWVAISIGWDPSVLNTLSPCRWQEMGGRDQISCICFSFTTFQRPRWHFLK